MRRLHAAGMGVTELARRFAVSKRTVYRAIGAPSTRDIEVARHE